MTREPIITEHAVERAGERLGLNAKALRRTAEKAFSKGLRHDQVNGKLRTYLDNQFRSHGSADNMRIHAEHVWIFCGRTLVTVWRLPNAYKTAAKKCLNRRDSE